MLKVQLETNTLFCLSIHLNSNPLSYKGYAIAEPERALKSIYAINKVEEVVIIQKCNSTEIYCYGDVSCINQVLTCWKIHSDSPDNFNSEEVHQFSGKQCIRQALDTASGLKSVTIGDNQVIGQVRESYALARRNKTTGPVMLALFSMARRISSTIKDTTKIGLGNTSVARSAVDIMLLSTLNKNTKILIYGAGMTGTLVSKILKEKGFTNIDITNRTLSKATDIVKRGNATKVIDFKNSLSLLGDYDVTFFTTNHTIDSKQVNNTTFSPSALIFDLGNPANTQNFPKDLNIIGIEAIQQQSAQSIGARNAKVGEAHILVEKAIKDVIREIDQKLTHNKIKENFHHFRTMEYNRDFIKKFEAKSNFLNHIRQSLLGDNFVEVETPYVVAVPSDPIRSYEEEIFTLKWYTKNMHLRQSNQIHKQILILGGFDKIFEIGPFWRAESSPTPRHLSESHGLDVEIFNPEDVFHLVSIIGKLLNDVTSKMSKEQIINKSAIVNPSLKIFEYDEIQEILAKNQIKHNYDEDMGFIVEKQLSEIIAKEYGIDIFAIVHYPRTIKKFYTQSYGDSLTETFDVIYRGWEISSGAIRETNVSRVRDAMSEFGISPDKYFFYFDRFKSQRPHGGFCLGTDRFFAKLLNLDNINESLVFPRSKNIVIP